MEGFRACFADLEDPRSGNAQRHELDEIVMIALLATLCGAETCIDMALFARSKEALLRRFLAVSRATTLSRKSFGCSIPPPSRPALPAIWRPCRSGSRAWSRSTARPPAAPSSASRAGHRCT